MFCKSCRLEIFSLKFIKTWLKSSAILWNLPQISITFKTWEFWTGRVKVNWLLAVLPAMFTDGDWWMSPGPCWTSTTEADCPGWIEADIGIALSNSIQLIPWPSCCWPSRFCIWTTLALFFYSDSIWYYLFRKATKFINSSNVNGNSHFSLSDPLSGSILIMWCKTRFCISTWGY